MVSYYNPVAMFSRTGSGHHHHHTSPTPNHYFAPTYGTYHPHHHHHNHTGPPNPAGVGVGVGVGVSSTQFSPNMPPEVNCNHYYNHQFGNMTSDSAIAAAASWHQPAAATAAAVYSACHRMSGYEEWPHQHGGGGGGGGGGHHTSTATSFYPHQQPSPPSSTPSPNSTQTGGGGGGLHSNNNNHNNSNHGNHSPNNVYNHTFKTEFGPCSGGNPQENTSQEMQGPVVSSAGPSIGTPHSPDSGMAISDGVSSSGSPATGVVVGQQQQQNQHCQLGGGGGGGGGGGAHHLTSNNVTSLNGSMIGSQQNLNQTSLHPQRPAQARSPFEWMKKPSYSVSSNSGGKTRTKDKYRVVYSDTQRLELEKEFHYSRYITIRRKAELALGLGLSERQVKIWFQNRRAKERKVHRKREEMIHREKIATMVHMQSAVAAATGMPTGPMCNQGNGNTIPTLM